MIVMNRRRQVFVHMPDFSGLPFGPNGLTLLEVLIALFVLIVAVLGLISVIPLAARGVEEAVKADRTQVCGLTGMYTLASREILSQADGMKHRICSPYAWADVLLRPMVPTTNTPLDARQGYAIDPWLIAQTAEYYLNGNNQVIDPGFQYLDRFPYRPPVTSPGDDWYWPELTLKRVTLLAPMSLHQGVVAQKGMWLRVFRAEDDLATGDPLDGSDRPTLIFNFGGGTRPLRAGAHGHYSWLATVSSEDPPDPQRGNLLPLQGPRRYRLAVVVFHKRSLLTPVQYDGIGPSGQPTTEEPAPETPPERTVVATVLGSVTGTVTLKLVVPPARSGYLENIPAGTWVMLTGWNPIWDRAVHEWYKVISVGEVYTEGVNVVREITAIGREWPIDPTTGWCLRDRASAEYRDFNGDGQFPDVQVCLFDGVVGVYWTTMEVF